MTGQGVARWQRTSPRRQLLATTSHEIRQDSLAKRLPLQRRAVCRQTSLMHMPEKLSSIPAKGNTRKLTRQKKLSLIHAACHACGCHTLEPWRPASVRNSARTRDPSRRRTSSYRLVIQHADHLGKDWGVLIHFIKCLLKLVDLNLWIIVRCICS